MAGGKQDSVREAVSRLFYRMSCALSKEIYFDKYDRGGAYHWRSYYESKNPFYVKKIQIIKGMVPAGSKVLDIGCGDGLIAHVLAQELQCRVTGIDSHPLAISLAKQKDISNNEFIVRSAYSRFPHADYDVVLAVEIFEHLRKPERMLKRIKEALKPEGSFIVTTPLVLESSSKPKGRHHFKEYTKDEFHKILGQYFTIADENYFDYPEGKTNCYLVKCMAKSKA